MITFFIFLAIYLAGFVLMLGYSASIFSMHKKNLLIFIRITFFSWYSVGRIAGSLLMEKRQREAAFAEAQRKAIEKEKHRKTGLVVPMNIIKPS